MFFIEYFEEIMDYSPSNFGKNHGRPWFSLNILKKSWTVVHGFHQIFEYLYFLLVDLPL